MIKPVYLNINELGTDCLELLEEYVNGLNLDDYSLDEIVKLCPVLIDIFNLTYSKKPKSDRDPLEYRVYTMTVSLMSEAFGILHSLKDDPDVSSNGIYSSTMRAISRLKKTVDLFKAEEETIAIDPKMSDAVYLSLGLNNELK